MLQTGDGRCLRRTTRVQLGDAERFHRLCLNAEKHIVRYLVRVHFLRLKREKGVLLTLALGAGREVCIAGVDGLSATVAMECTGLKDLLEIETVGSYSKPTVNHRRCLENWRGITFTYLGCVLRGLVVAERVEGQGRGGKRMVGISANANVADSRGSH